MSNNILNLTYKIILPLGPILRRKSTLTSPHTKCGLGSLFIFLFPESFHNKNRPKDFSHLAAESNSTVGA